MTREQWKSARVVDVRMREHDGVDRSYVDRQRDILFPRFASTPLEHSAVEEDGSPSHFENVA